MNRLLAGFAREGAELSGLIFVLVAVGGILVALGRLTILGAVLAISLFAALYGFGILLRVFNFPSPGPD